MDKKITSKEAAHLLAKYILKHCDYCPVSGEAYVPDCECWKSEQCENCLLRHANQLDGSGVEIP